MKEKTAWYGKEAEGRKYLFKGLREKPVMVIMALRNGEIPETEENPSEEVPDLREIAIRFARERIEEEFRREQYLIRIHSFKEELDRIINLYFEQVMPLSNVIPQMSGKDPCTVFSLSSGDSLIDGILKEGKGLCDLRSILKERMEMEIRRLMPNSTALVGTDICMDLLSASRTLKKLAELPSGAIQVMGAEKSFFKHQSEGTPSPKHGFIYKYAGISSLSRNRRGKVCRLIASRLSMAIRADYFGRKVDVEGMKGEIKARMSQ